MSDIGLTIDLRGVVLRCRGRNRRIAQDDLVGHAAGDFDAERERRDIEQQHVFGGFRTAAKDVRLHRGAECYHLVGIQIGVRLALE